MAVPPLFNIPANTTDILVDIPNSAEVLSSLTFSNTKIEILQCPRDTKGKTGIHYAHVHNTGLRECCTIKLTLPIDSRIDYIRASQELFAFFCNFVMYKREENRDVQH